MFGSISRKVAPAGLAILSHPPEREVDDYFARVDPEGDWGAAHSESAIRSRIESTRRTGYAVNPALLVEGSWGIGAAVFDRTGRPPWTRSRDTVQAGAPSRIGESTSRAGPRVVAALAMSQDAVRSACGRPPSAPGAVASRCRKSVPQATVSGYPGPTHSWTSLSTMGSPQCPHTTCGSTS